MDNFAWCEAFNAACQLAGDDECAWPLVRKGKNLVQALRCDDCGRFMTATPGSSWANIYDFVAMELSHTHVRCAHCTSRLGPVESNARPHDGDMTTYQGDY